MGYVMTALNPNLVDPVSNDELQNLLSRPTCFKGANPSCIDNFLTTRKSRFMKTLTLETGISHHHTLIGTVLRSTFAKGKPKTNFYRYYKNVDNKEFEETLIARIAIYENF